MDWLIGTSCYSAEVGQNYSERKVESVRDKGKVMDLDLILFTGAVNHCNLKKKLCVLQCILCVSYIDENNLRLVKSSQKKSLQDIKPMSVHPRKVNLRSENAQQRCLILTCVYISISEA